MDNLCWLSFLNERVQASEDRSVHLVYVIQCNRSLYNFTNCKGVDDLSEADWLDELTVSPIDHALAFPPFINP